MSTRDFLFVLSQFFLFAVYFLTPVFVIFPENQVVTSIGFIFFFLGVTIFFFSTYELRNCLSPFPSPVKKGYLITTGIYNYVRHPIYTGIVIALAGYAIATPHSGKLFVTGLLATLFFFKSKFEEKLLLATYPDYRSYMKRTWRFFPGF